MIRKRIHKDQTDSTNNDIRLLAIEGEPEGCVVSADVQTAGRGRRGRSWESPAGSSLLFSILLRPDIPVDAAPQITLLMALAVAKVVRQRTGLEALIKWPNDVVVNRKKICGILTEMQVKDGAIDHVVVGTGVNMNQTNIPEELEQSATSLLLEMNRIQGVQTEQSEECGNGETECVNLPDRDELLEHILIAFEGYYDLFLQKQDLSDLMKEYNLWLVSLDKEVKVLDPQGEFTGISKGINEKGELLVELTDGEVTAIYAGEVSVRGLYGYV